MQSRLTTEEERVFEAAAATVRRLQEGRAAD